MSYTPDVIIYKSRKFVRDLLAGLSVLMALLAFQDYVTGGNPAPELILCAGSALVASKIKYRGRKVVEAARYKPF